MDVDCPMISLKRSSSAPMINQISATMSTPSTSSSREAVACNIFSNSLRTRRFSTSSFGIPRLTPRISQLRQEESIDIRCREAAHERELHSAMLISQSWEDLSLEAEGLSFKDSESPTQQLNKSNQKKSLDPLNLNLSITGSPLCSSLSPTSGSPRSGFIRCYSPGIQTINCTNSPSPTRKSITIRRSLSPIAIRPSCLGPVKRKFELDDAGNHLPPAKRTSGLLTSVISRLDGLSSPLPGTISSVGTPESLSGADSPSFSFRPVDSPSPMCAVSCTDDSLSDASNQTKMTDQTQTSYISRETQR